MTTRKKLGKKHKKKPKGFDKAFDNKMDTVVRKLAATALGYRENNLDDALSDLLYASIHLQVQHGGISAPEAVGRSAMIFDRFVAPYALDREKRETGKPLNVPVSTRDASVEVVAPSGKKLAHDLVIGESPE